MYSYINNIGNSIFLTKYVNGEKKFVKDNNFKPYVFVSCSKDTGWKSFPEGNDVGAIHFDSISSFKEDIKMYPKENVYGNIGRGMVELQKIRKDKLAENYDLSNLEVFYLDIEVFSDDGFPHANLAEHPITAITIKSRKEDKFYVWALTNEYKKHLDNIELRSFNSETQLLQDFVEFIGKSDCDVLTGWNCIDENQTVWLRNKIKKIKDVRIGDKTCFDGKIKNHKFTGLKKNFKMKLINGQEIISSDNHIFPYYFKDKNSYKNRNSLLKNYKEEDIKTIINDHEKNDIFIKVDKHINNNDDLTLRKMIIDNFEYFKNHEFFDFIIIDTKIRDWLKKNTDIKDYFEHREYFTGQNFWKNCRQKWSYKRLKHLIPEELILDYINDSDFLITNGKLNNKIFLDDIIDNRIIQMLGLIYTDGFYSKYDKNIGFCGKDIEMIKDYVNDLDDILTRSKKYKKSFDKHKDGCCYQSFTKNNIFAFLLPIIYNENIKKTLNIEILSMFSRKQFSAFISGMIDGDGYISEGINICNYEKNDSRTCVQKLQELLLWNNVLTISNENRVYFTPNTSSNIDFIELLNIKNTKRKLKLNEIKQRKIKNSISKSIRLFEYDNFYLVRVKSITELDHKSRMYDIETENSLFNSNGLKTHNCKFFDIPYIYNRGIKLLGKNIKKLSPFSVLLEKKLKQRNGEELLSCEIVGINHLDYIDLYKKFTYTSKESYALQNIAQEELGVSKLDYSDEGDLANLWIVNKQKYLEYNIHDVELVYLLDKSMGFIDLAHSLCYYTNSPIDKYASNTFLWTAKLFNTLMDMKQVLPSQQKKDDSGGIIGAFVKDPQCKKHGWLISVDLASLYPSLIRQYNLSHETFLHSVDINAIEDMVKGTFDFEPYIEENTCFMPLGSVFSKEHKGLLPRLMENLYKQRKQHKKESIENFNKAKSETDPVLKEKYFALAKKLHNIQMAEKILLNSLYGALTYKSFILNKREIGESITSMGQVANRYCSDRINAYINKLLKTDNIDYIIAGDTDSLYISMQAFVDKIMHKNPTKEQIVKYIDKISSEVIEPKIAEIYEEMFEYTGAYENHMLMEREVIADRALWVAKKKYVCRVLDSEGKSFIDNPDIKYMGIQIKRSDTPAKVKEYLKETINKIFDDEDIDAYMSEVENMIRSSKIEEVAIPKGMNGLEKYKNVDGWIKGCPMHVRAAIVHNNYVKQMNLQNKVREIKSGDKIKMVPLKLPNPVHQDVIAFDGHRFPKEFELDEYIDWDTIVHKTYRKVIEDILEKIGEERKETHDFNALLSLFE